jgi:RNA polymerase sigma-70 factor, ECF subfamily
MEEDCTDEGNGDAFLWVPSVVVCVEEDAASRHAAFDRFVTPEIDRLHGAARVLTHGRDTAEDLVQDTLVRAYRALCRFDGRYPRAWLLTILRNVFYKDAVRHHDLPVAEVPGVEIADPADALAFDDALRRALDRLPASQRRVVELVDVVGLAYAEAAAAIGVPVGTVMSRLHRARARLREELLP